MSYADRIATALHKLPNHTGHLMDIWDVIENDPELRKGLNWKLESDARNTYVWKSSVRKILKSNSRFKNPFAADKHTWCLA